MELTGIHLTNFKMFRDVKLDRMTRYAVFVGANGAGKTSFFDVFGFLKDCLQQNVRAALAKRGGFREVLCRAASAGATIGIQLRARMQLPVGTRTVTYRLEIGEQNGRVSVVAERLRYTRFGGGGKPYDFLNFAHGEGSAITNEGDASNDESFTREQQRLDEPDILAIKGLGQFQRFEAARALRSLIENWHVSDFHIQAARPSQEAGYAEHLSPQGENLPLVAQFMYERHRDEFDKVLAKMAQRVPGISKVEPMLTQDGRLVLRFQDGSFKDPFVSRYVSDGTIKMFAYLLLLHDPQPHPLLCVEEPENQLYPLLLGELSEEFEDYARRGGQVMVSTHSPDLLNDVPFECIYLLAKRGGTTSIRRAADNPNLKALIDEGDKPGYLWRQRLFEGVDP